MRREKKKHQNAKHGHMIQWNPNGHNVLILLGQDIKFELNEWKKFTLSK